MNKILLGATINILVAGSFFITSCSNTTKIARADSAQKTSAAADELLLATGELRKEINKKIEENPNSSSEDFVALVDKKTKEIERTQTQVEHLATKRTFEITQKRSFDKIRACQQRLGNLSREITAIHKSFEKELDKKLKSDIYFDTGSANISETGNEELKKIILSDFDAIINEWKREEVYRDKSLKVKIKITGYADLQGSQNLEVRQKNNLSISEKRAETVKNIVMGYLDELRRTYKLEVYVESEGKGEEPPPGLLDLGMVNNPERRACFISGYVIPVF